MIATNDPENQNTVEIDLKAEIAKCGQSYGNRKYFYEQDISTADQQRRAGVLAQRGNAVDPNDDATSVMCFCDLVAPPFLYQEEDIQQYYPENIIVGLGLHGRRRGLAGLHRHGRLPAGRHAAPSTAPSASGRSATRRSKFTGPGPPGLHRRWRHRVRRPSSRPTSSGTTST